MTGNRKPAHKDHDAFYAALGRRIKELRRERGWSLSHMHAAFGYVTPQWVRFEKGSSITIDTLLKLAEIFEIELVDLIDSLGKFPSKPMDDVAVDPAHPTPAEKTVPKSAERMVKKPSKRAKGRQRSSSK